MSTECSFSSKIMLDTATHCLAWPDLCEVAYQRVEPDRRPVKSGSVGRLTCVHKDSKLKAQQAKLSKYVIDVVLQTV